MEEAVFFRFGRPALNGHCCASIAQLWDMKLVAFGDLHFRRHWFDFITRVIAEGRFDAVCIAGDFLDAHPNALIPLQRQVDWVLAWFRKLPAGRTRITAVRGNHDYLEDEDPSAETNWLQRARHPGVDVDGDVVSFGGWSFVCRPWIGEVATPSGQTVVLAHAPPEGTELARRNGWDEGGDYSTRLVAEDLRGTKSIVLSGHVHEPDAWLDFVGDVACFNPGCDFTSRIPRHIIVDTDKRRAELLTAEGVIGPLAF